MTKKKTAKNVIVPQRKAKTKSEGTAAGARSQNKARKRDAPMWNTSDLDFDSKGRLVIINERLARSLAANVRQDSEIIVVLPPRGPIPFPPPGPVDAMCGCNTLRLALEEESEIIERIQPELEHGVRVGRGTRLRP